MRHQHTRDQFCILGYRSEQQKLAENETKLILVGRGFLDVEDDHFKLELFVDPGWPAFVSEDDRHYIEALFKDLAERAIQDAETLFEQLCSLEVGPLVARQVGRGTSETSSALSMIEQMVQL